MYLGFAVLTLHELRMRISVWVCTCDPAEGVYVDDEGFWLGDLKSAVQCRWAGGGDPAVEHAWHAFVKVESVRVSTETQSLATITTENSRAAR